MSGDQLWRTDGTEEGTVKVVDPAGPGVETGYSTDILGFVDGWIYFGAVDGVHGEELWRSDGTEEGSELVADLVPGEESGSPRHLVELHDAIYFIAEVAEGGEMLFRCDLE
jgi:ELWxxDGT repeat protein